jgi:hypothetical protein
MLKMDDLKTAIDAIAEQNGGRITPRNVVNAATNPSHILHACFEWDDKAAADRHRLAVAANLIRSVKYTAYDVESRPVTTVAYVWDAPTNTHVPLSDVAREEKASRALLAQELAAIESHIRRAQKIAEAIHMREYLDNLLHACIDARQKVADVSKPKRRRNVRDIGMEHHLPD